MIHQGGPGTHQSLPSVNVASLAIDRRWLLVQFLPPRARKMNLGEIFSRSLRQGFDAPETPRVVP